MVRTFRSHSCLHGAFRTWTNLLVFSSSAWQAGKSKVSVDFSQQSVKFVTERRKCSRARLPPESFLPFGLLQNFPVMNAGVDCHLSGFWEHPTERQSMKCEICLVQMEAVGFLPLPDFLFSPHVELQFQFLTIFKQ